MTLQNDVVIRFPDRYMQDHDISFDASGGDFSPVLNEMMNEQGWVLIARQRFFSVHAEPGEAEALGIEDDLPDLECEAQADETGITLLERDGIFTWVLPEPATRPIGKKRRLSFRLFKKRRGTNGLGAEPPWREFVIRVFRWALEETLTLAAQPLVKLLEARTREGLVLIRGVDIKRDWEDIEALDVARLPDHRPARVLLLIPGTMATVDCSFDILSIPPASRLLEGALKKYDIVVGYDHKTLSRDPGENACTLAEKLGESAWPRPPLLDIITTSRGAEVGRALIERVIPESDFQCVVRRMIMVAPTLGGSLLVEDENWYALANHLTHLASVLHCALRALPGANVAAHSVGKMLCRISILLKAMAHAYLSSDAVPGLAAMDPTGEFIAFLNQTPLPPQPEPAPVYHTLTSDFDAWASKIPEAVETAPEDQLLATLASLPVDALFRHEANDLIVDNASIARIHPDLQTRLADSVHFSRNRTVYHLNFFSQWDTLKFIDQKLALNVYP